MKLNDVVMYRTVPINIFAYCADTACGHIFL